MYEPYALHILFSLNPYNNPTVCYHLHLQMRKFRLRKIRQTYLLRNKAWNRAQVYLPQRPEIFLAVVLFRSLAIPQIASLSPKRAPPS